ncbi:MAG: hypothetical protein F4Y27_08925 [Acidimicrobiaceae bacterium]|nr:restriction endonuclease subunit S [Acidimicrobiaceae bacterium]MXW60629.1 hypothetical protein [Acidimicrobiaceae bacterium]MXW76078.1 hypothetical protein [Acidimicrobiaceae bacterium]MYA74785.1 hypothetical protein [Acidimicrobiaceae bacterium]MYC40947.1 hypothetical protein [Acidimicrobiaceae bacterium]
MGEWQRVPLGEAFEVQLGKMLGVGSDRGEQSKYLANRNVQWGQIVIDELGTMNFSPRERERYRLQSGDLLVCEGGEVGRAALWSDELPECYFQNALHRLRATTGADHRFMRYYFEFASMTGLLRGLTGQTSIGHLPRSKLVNWVVPFPPVEEQRRIAEILDTIDETIQSTERVITKHKRIRSGLSDDLLNGKVGGDRPENPKTSETPPPRAEPPRETCYQVWGQVDDLVDLVTTKAHGQKPVGFPYIGLEHIEPGARTLTATAPSSVSQSTNGVFAEGDILFGKLRPNLRKALQVGCDGFCSTDILVLRTKAAVNPRYATHAVASESVFRHAERNSIGTGMPRTSWLAVSQATVLVPPLEEQRRIAEILDNADETIRTHEEQRDKLQRMRSGLAADLLSGRVRTVAA